MVRMQPLNPELVQPDAPQTGPQAQVWDDIMNALGNKRSRPNSSLDYKSPSQTATTPKTMPPPPPPADSAKDTTAAKNENLYRTLQDKPGINERLASSSSSPPVPKTREERLEILKQEGFPFIQWALIGVLLLYGVYRIYKAFKSDTATTARKTRARGKSATKSSKSLRSKTPEKPLLDDDVVNRVVAEITGETVEEAPAPPPAKKTPKKKPQQPKKQKTKSKPKATSDDETDVTPAPAPAPIHNKPTPPPEPIIDDEGGWQTVGGSNGVANKSKPVETTVQESKPTPTPTNGSATKKEEVVVVEEEPSSATNKKQKGKKKKKTKTTPPELKNETPAKEPEVVPDSDEALAKKLQHEEELKVESTVVLTEEWAKVPTKKKKSKA